MPTDRPLTLMTLHAHPDDETIGTGGTMARAVRDGHRVVLVTCTRGELGEIVVRTIHRVEPLDGGRARVSYRMEITGPDAATLGPQIGPEISADFPQTLAALVERAKS